jgi:hypothetical protein
MTQFPEIWNSNFETMVLQTFIVGAYFNDQMEWFFELIVTMFTTCGGGNNDISKLLYQGEITQMRRSAQLEIGTTESDTINMTMGWIEITTILESNESHKKQLG